MITEIWSGGQTGVDQGALEAAKECGLRTGGWMPKDFLTEDGPRPEFAERFGLQAMIKAEYPPRTKRNAKESDGTLWIEGPGDVAEDSGYRTTSKAAEQYGKPFHRVAIADTAADAAAAIARWAEQHGIKRLNVAGPRASRWPSGQTRAQEILRRLLRISGR